MAPITNTQSPVNVHRNKNSLWEGVLRIVVVVFVVVFVSTVSEERAVVVVVKEVVESTGSFHFCKIQSTPTPSTKRPQYKAGK
jgi:hypothetical protein